MRGDVHGFHFGQPGKGQGADAEAEQSECGEQRNERSGPETADQEMAQPPGQHRKDRFAGRFMVKSGFLEIKVDQQNGGQREHGKTGQKGKEGVQADHRACHHQSGPNGGNPVCGKRQDESGEGEGQTVGEEAKDPKTGQKRSHEAQEAQGSFFGQAPGLTDRREQAVIAAEDCGQDRQQASQQPD